VSTNELNGGEPLRFRKVQRFGQLPGFSEDGLAAFFQLLEFGQVQRIKELLCIFLVLTLEAVELLRHYAEYAFSS
jgi:hypothetical protein